MRKLKHTYSSCNQYAERDIEQLGDHYMVHLDAMTVESLHSKSSIAAELAFRDKRIAELEKEVEYIKEGKQQLSKLYMGLYARYSESVLKEQGK